MYPLDRQQFDDEKQLEIVYRGVRLRFVTPVSTIILERASAT